MIMQVRRIGAALGTALFLGAAGITQAVTVTPAAAAPADSAQVSGFRDFQKGLSKGYRDGWRMAREECEKPPRMTLRLNAQESDYERGYERGFGKGFASGFMEYCN
jgi:hypothetical protein